MRKVRETDGPPPESSAPVVDGLMLAMDPGLRESGVTVATMQGRVVDAWLARSPAKSRQVDGQHVPAPGGLVALRAMVGAVLADVQSRGYLHRLTLLVLEWPEVYQEAKKGKLKRANPNVLLDLAGVDGGLACQLPALARYERFTPREWKRQYPKKDYQAAILHALSPAERALVERTTESLRHNVVESVGLARFMATVLAGAPMSVPAFQGRARPALKPPAPPPQSALPLPAPEKAPSWRTPLPPGSTSGAPSYGSRHAQDFARALGGKDARQLLRNLRTGKAKLSPAFRPADTGKPR